MVEVKKKKEIEKKELLLSYEAFVTIRDHTVSLLYRHAQLNVKPLPVVRRLISWRVQQTLYCGGNIQN